MLPLPVLTRIANRPTPAKLRVEAMGWKFGPVQVGDDIRSDTRYVGGPYVGVRGVFTCLCGKKEFFSATFCCEELEDEKTAAMLLDVYAALERGGSFSKQHLIDDGYTPEQVAEILRKGEEYDRQLEQN